MTRATLAAGACAGLALTSVAAAQARDAQQAPARPHHPSASAAIDGADLTSRAFFTATLHRLKLPVTEANLDALYAVENREGPNDRYNPLNVVQPEPGSTDYNSVGVQRYRSFATGVDGTVHLMRNGHWTGVRAALRHGKSTARVLQAFSNAYTWDNGISFATSRAALDAQAVRDVGGHYADPGLAARRAASAQAGLKSRIADLQATLDDAQVVSQNAHRDYAGRQAASDAIAPTAARQAASADALEQVASRDHDVVVNAITSDYMSDDGAGSVGELLTSDSPSAYLNSENLNGYASIGQRRLFKRYAAEKRRADVAAAVAARSTAVIAKAHRAMAADRDTWTHADARAAAARTTLRGILHAAQRDSITQPIAVAALRRLG